jgi:UDPglucose 6-dehydrogenase
LNIGIMGFGVVGRALYNYYCTSHTVWTYDIKDDSEADLLALNRNADVVFICVSTPYSGDGKGLDCSQVYKAVDALTGSKKVIIKSTVMPGTTDAIAVLHPEHELYFIPEFLCEDCASEDYANPRRTHVVGSVKELGVFKKLTICELLSPSSFMFEDGISDIELHKRIFDTCNFLPAKQAELLKLATNTFYALKVTYANLLYDAGMSQEAITALGNDPWIGNSHFNVNHKGYRGFGGKCLVKDSLALESYINLKPLIPNIVNEMNNANYMLLKSQGIDPQEFFNMQKTEV